MISVYTATKLQQITESLIHCVTINKFRNAKHSQIAVNNNQSQHTQKCNHRTHSRQNKGLNNSNYQLIITAGWNFQRNKTGSAFFDVMIDKSHILLGDSTMGGLLPRFFFVFQAFFLIFSAVLSKLRPFDYQ